MIDNSLFRCLLVFLQSGIDTNASARATVAIGDSDSLKEQNRTLTELIICFKHLEYRFSVDAYFPNI